MDDLDFDDLLNVGLEDTSKTVVSITSSFIKPKLEAKNQNTYARVEVINKSPPPISVFATSPKITSTTPLLSNQNPQKIQVKKVSSGTTIMKKEIKPKSDLKTPSHIKVSIVMPTASKREAPVKEKYRHSFSVAPVSSPLLKVSEDKQETKKEIANIKKKQKMKRNSMDNIGKVSELFGGPVAQIQGLPGTNYIRMEKIIVPNDLVNAINSTDFNEELVNDPWSSIETPMDNWKDEKVEQGEFIVNVKCFEESGYHLELHSESIVRKTDLHKFNIVDVDQNYEFYKNYFKGKKNVSYYMDPVSLELLIVDTSTKYKKALLKTPKNNYRVVIPPTVDPNKYPKVFTRLATDKKCKPKTFAKGNIEKLERELEKIEEMSMIKRYKFGIIHVKDGQTEENEWFANDECDPTFWDFMNLIADKIELKGFTGYRGGLDVQRGCTGTHSYYTTYDDIEIMFHVAPLLPNQPNDLQKLERKRHVGNDVVVVIVLDPNRKEPFDPRILTSHFNNIFFIIQPKIVDGVEGYVVNIATKSDNKPFPPYLHSNWMKKDEYFKYFILRKLINSERISMHNVTFVTNARNTRKMQLTEISKMLK